MAGSDLPRPETEIRAMLVHEVDLAAFQYYAAQIVLMFEYQPTPEGPVMTDRARGRTAAGYQELCYRAHNRAQFDNVVYDIPLEHDVAWVDAARISLDSLEKIGPSAGEPTSRYHDFSPRETAFQIAEFHLMLKSLRTTDTHEPVERPFGREYALRVFRGEIERTGLKPLTVEDLAEIQGFDKLKRELEERLTQAST